MNARLWSLVRRLRDARWVNLKVPLVRPPAAETREAELLRLREHLRMLNGSERSIRAWEFVSAETRAKKLVQNAQAKTVVQARIAALGGGKGSGRTRSVHPL
jgi:hypothetical protein